MSVILSFPSVKGESSVDFDIVLEAEEKNLPRRRFHDSFVSSQFISKMLNITMIWVVWCSMDLQRKNNTEHMGKTQESSTHKLKLKKNKSM